MTANLKDSKGWLQSGGWVLLLSALPLLGLLLFFMAIGWNSRYLADDYCTAGWLESLGFWDSQTYWRAQWSGRFSFFFIMNLLQLLGPGVSRILPGVMLGCWSLSLFAVTRSLSQGNRFSPYAGLLIAGVAPAITLSTTPNLYQSYLWQTGLITYVLPLVLITVLASWILRSQLGPQKAGMPWQAAFSGLLALMVGGFSETMAAVQLALLASGLGIFVVLPELRARFQRGLRHLLAASAGALIALVLVISAPGNKVRQELVGGPNAISQTLEESLYNTYIFAARLYRHELLWLLLAFLLSLSLVHLWRSRNWQAELNSRRIRLGRHLIALILVPAATVMLIMATMMPSAYALNSYPDARVLVMAHYWVVLAILIWGGVLGSLVADRVSAKVARSLVIIVGIISFGLAGFLTVVGVSGNQALLKDAREFARSWDQRHEELSMADANLETVPAASLSHMGGLDELERDSDYWVNRCLAMTYGLRQVTAK